MIDKNLEQCSDEELIIEFQQNETIRAYEILVRRFKDPLMNFVYRFLGDYESCSDVVQETMIRVYRNKHSYKSIAKFSTWIYTIAGNLAKTELQRRRRKYAVSMSSFGEDDEPMELEDKGTLMPDVIVDSGIKEKMIQDALLKISVTYREVVIMRDIQDMTYEEIAEITKLEIGTVKSRINRGRAQLQKLLKDIYKE